MNEASTFSGVNIICCENRKSVRTRSATLSERRIACKVREHWIVAPASHLSALKLAHNLIVFAKFLSVGTKQRLTNVELFASKLAFSWANFHVINICTNYDCEVCWNCPRSSGPEYCVSIVFVAKLNSHGNGSVLTILVHIRIHAKLVGTKWSLVLRAVRKHAVTLVSQALIIKLLKCPHYGFHVWNVQRLVAALEINPASLTMHVVLPLVRILQNAGTASIVELCDAHFFDLLN